MTTSVTTATTTVLVTGDDALATYIDDLKGLIGSMSLYIKTDWVVRQLTQEQKELFADVIDEVHTRADLEDGLTGTDLAHRPFERWWRD